MKTTSLDSPLPPPTPTQEFSSPTTTFPSITIAHTATTNSAATSPSFLQHRHFNDHNPNKKRTKLLPNIDTQTGVSSPTSSHGFSPSKPKTKKPDPSLPKITRPCSECGKKFWSWKALFGHMRCHPERQWRGINPPPQFMRCEIAPPENTAGFHASMTEEDHEIAACLLLLANGGIGPDCPAVHGVCEVIGTAKQSSTLEYPDDNLAGEVLMITSGSVPGSGNEVVKGAGPSNLGCRFECSSCKKTFGSHQALGGHRASHRNVKGCFAIMRNEMLPAVVAEEENGRNEGVAGNSCSGSGGGGEDIMVVLDGHRCSICPRVFSSVQALGGHMRFHLERTDEEPTLGIHRGDGDGCVLDLNLPAPMEEQGFPPCCSSGLHLELKLGIGKTDPQDFQDRLDKC